jgi:hypothetical protein
VERIFHSIVCSNIYLFFNLNSILGTEITPKGDANRRKDCNQNAIRIGHIAELGTIIFPLLTVILQFVDELKKKVDASKKDHPVRFKKYNLF